MQQQDQTTEIDGQEQPPQTSGEESSVAVEAESDATIDASAQLQRGFDWPALFVALGIAAFFAAIARLNSQPAPSFVPVAVLSATGCGLLVTALHKVRRRAGIGLREAGLAAFGMTLFQFAITFTYPDLVPIMQANPALGRAFLLTWGLIAVFAIVLSLLGALVGHLVFAPLRPVPSKKAKQSVGEEEDEEDEEEIESEESEQATQVSAEAEVGDDQADQGEQEEQESDEEEIEESESLVTASAASVPTRRLLTNYTIAAFLLGLLPMMAGYVFAAAYDLLMNALKVIPGIYPTLSLLAGLLPWRLPFNLTGANASTTFISLWRIPDSITVNPNWFDTQSLEPLLFNAAALAFLLLTMYGSDHQQGKHQAAPWGIFLFLQALLGLLIVLPASIWLMRGLEGILHLGTLIAQLPTTQVINPTLFALNLATGVIFSLLVGALMRRQYQIWTAPRTSTPEEEEAEE
jgi:hypothetical protein